ncbi:hypothetical protein Nepgr_022809 [Nepenthes gracilis]|uniref:Uncharacterized protein n=1 Tax=Nepenthes gracilis TaxID=150966 RepID=A0AAD3XX55_NEPGR|nr:hypothetical protein Nepgr_022809 [Nepenthes gracilis]
MVVLLPVVVLSASAPMPLAAVGGLGLLLEWCWILLEMLVRTVLLIGVPMAAEWQHGVAENAPGWLEDPVGYNVEAGGDTS